MGDYAPRPEQLRLLVQEMAVLCVRERIPVSNILTQAEAADNEGFPRPDDRARSP